MLTITEELTRKLIRIKMVGGHHTPMARSNRCAKKGNRLSTQPINESKLLICRMFRRDVLQHCPPPRLAYLMELVLCIIVFPGFCSSNAVSRE